LSRRLRVAYVYRAFTHTSSIPSFFADRAERLARDEDVVVVCSANDRAETTAPIRFVDVEPVVRGRGRLSYAAECATFAWRASRTLNRLRADVDLVHVVGFAAPRADLVTVNAVRRAELEHYFARVEPRARIRRRLAPFVRPQSLVVELTEDRLFRAPYPLCLPETRAIADDLTHVYGVPADAIEVIPTGVDLDRFHPDPAARQRVRAEAGVDDSTLVVLFVGNEFNRKGLARAITGLGLARTPAQLWVAGDDDAGPYASRARSLGLEDRVRFLGSVPNGDLSGFYAAADLLLLPSQQDAWGQPVLEAMASGCVPVTSEYTGAHEIVENRENGFVLDGAGEPEQIAAVIDAAAADAASRTRLSERATVTAAAAFDRRVLYRRLRDAHHRAYARRMELR
jgi:UDP-glucose:(heptosyl)LPS alpha-1,3-glucosyltransferase